MNNIVIEKLDDCFVDKIATIHASALTGDILPALGYDFLVQYYQYVLQNRTQVVIGAVSKDRLVGFCQLSFSHISVIDILRIIPTATLYIARLMLLNPRLFISGIMLMLNQPKHSILSPEISFIAVRPDYQRLGIGKSLVEAANKIAANKGKVKITTKTSNKIARIMYEKLFDANIISNKSVLGKEYWYLTWETNVRKP
jgi:ribosomal protein S18 acetylase RimI-like enzyme